MVEICVQAVVRDENVRPAVVIVIACADGKILAFGLIDLCHLGHIRERAITVVVIENVWTAPVRLWRTTAAHPAQLAVTLAVRAQGHVTPYIEIELSITVIVEERRARVKLRSELEPGHSG